MEYALFEYVAQQSAAPPMVPEVQGSGGGIQDIFGQMGPMLMLGVVFVFTWFFMIRPQQKEEKRKKDLMNSLKKGDFVITASGILGSVATLKDDTVILKVGDGTRMEFLRSSIHSIREEGASKAEKSEKQEPSKEVTEPKTEKKKKS